MNVSDILKERLTLNNDITKIINKFR
jgi:hypothetical protein